MIVALDMQLAVGTATGVGVYARDLLAALQAEHAEVRALSAPWLDPWRFDRRVLWDQVLLPLAAVRSGAQVLHATSGTLPLVRTLPTVVTVHDMAWLRVQHHTPAYARAYFGGLMRRAYARADLIVVDSAFSRDEYLELSGDRRTVEIVAPGVDERFGAIVRRPDDDPFVLLVGTLERRKNAICAIETIARIPDVRLICVGPLTDYVDDARAAARSLGCADRVEFRGYVDRSTIDALYARAACALVPSRYEGFGYALAEARCAGVPVIAARSSSLVEIAADPRALIAPDDGRAWEDALRALLEDRSRAEAAAARDRGAALVRFRWARAAQELRALYARVAR